MTCEICGRASRVVEIHKESARVLCHQCSRKHRLPGSRIDLFPGQVLAKVWKDMEYTLTSWKNHHNQLLEELCGSGQVQRLRNQKDLTHD